MTSGLKMEQALFFESWSPCGHTSHYT